MDERLFCVRHEIQRLTKEIIDKEWEFEDTDLLRIELHRLVKLESEGVTYEPRH